jgi:hypothetical protein
VRRSATPWPLAIDGRLCEACPRVQRIRCACRGCSARPSRTHRRAALLASSASSTAANVPFRRSPHRITRRTWAPAVRSINNIRPGRPTVHSQGRQPLVGWPSETPALEGRQSSSRRNVPATTRDQLRRALSLGMNVCCAPATLTVALPGLRVEKRTRHQGPRASLRDALAPGN